MKKIANLIFISLLSSLSLKAQEWDPSKITRDIQWTFRMSQGADSLGFSRIEIKKIGEQLLLSEDAEVPGFSEDLFVYVNPKDLSTDSTLIVGRLSGFPVECKIVVTNGVAKGYANFPKHPSRPTVNVNFPITPTTKFRAQSFFFSPFYRDLTEGKSFSYDQFNAMDGQKRTIQAKVVGSEKVSIGDQIYDTFKLELSGGVAEQNIFIEKTNPRIVKMSFRDTPWKYEIIESQSF